MNKIIQPLMQAERGRRSFLKSAGLIAGGLRWPARAFAVTPPVPIMDGNICMTLPQEPGIT